MIELRWVVPEHATTKPPKLQYRILFYPVMNISGDVGLYPYESCVWMDVPVVVKRAEESWHD